MDFNIIQTCSIRKQRMMIRQLKPAMHVRITYFHKSDVLEFDVSYVSKNTNVSSKLKFHRQGTVTLLLLLLLLLFISFIIITIII